METVVVQGLGFVGSVMSLVVADSDQDYQVIGVDLPANQGLIDKLNSGVFPIESSDMKVYEYFDRVKKKKNFKATSDIEVYRKADVVIVDINLDVNKSAWESDYSAAVSLEGFKKAIRSVANRCKEDVLIIVETTIPPGTCEFIVKPIFEEEFEKRGLSKKYKIGHSYERVMPGPGYLDSIKNFYRVYSGIDEDSAQATEMFLKTIISTDNYPLTRLSSTNATEMAKVLENSFRAMNIAFIQEWTEFSEAAGVNLFEVIQAIRMRPTHKNIMKPGLGVGGYCLTKDPLLASWSSQYLFDANKLSQSEKAVEINDNMPSHSFKWVKKIFDNHLKARKILILGVSYLNDIGDTRYTPVRPLYKALANEGAEITIHDPMVENWEELGLATVSDNHILTSKFDAIIIGTPHSYYFEKKIIEQILETDQNIHVLDPHGVIDDEMLEKFKNHTFKIIGRGDV